MNKREFLKKVGVASLGFAVLPMFHSQGNLGNFINNGTENDTDSSGFNLLNDTKEPAPFTLPDLGFSYSALEPSIDGKTMEIHYSKHHGGYVKKLNTSLEKSDLKNKTLVEILEHVSDSEKDNDIRNNAGGHFNHSLFWEILLPGGAKQPSEKLLSQINSDFGSVEAFNTEFTKKASEVFGSGWAWLCVDKHNKLFISNTSNQDNPLMKKIVDKTGTPILGIDVWEHAYYLKYQNERKKYLASFMNVINWDVVGQKFEKTIK